jgi:hypothetical protein
MGEILFRRILPKTNPQTVLTFGERLTDMLALAPFLVYGGLVLDR